MAKANQHKQTAPFSQALLVPLLLSLMMWVVYKLDVAWKLKLYTWAVFPGKTESLGGIITSPLIHDTSGYYHILENTIALLFFGTLMFYFYRTIALRVLFFSWISTQTLVWLLAQPVYHVGMSGVIYALAFFLLTGSVYRKNRQLTGVLFLIIFLYGSIFWGLFPLIPGISWESHLYGAVSGLALGVLYRNVAPNQVKVVPPIEDDPKDDEPDAWWRTGVIKEEKPDNADFVYHYRSKDQDGNEKP